MATWPTSLPQRPLADSYSEAAEPSTIRTAMEIGPAKMRRRYTSEIKLFTMEFLMSTAQVATFETFFVTTLAAGSLTFDWINHRTDAAVIYRFTARPTIQPQAPGYWLVSAELEITP